MASKFVLALNSLRIQMICSKEKMGLLSTWINFNKDPELKAFLEVWDNHEKAAAVLQSPSANEDFQGLHVGSIGLNSSIALLNEMKDQFGDLKGKLDLIVSWSVSKTFGENELEAFPNLACHNEIVPAPVPLLLTSQMIAKYVQEFIVLKSKVESLKIKLNRICGSIINKKVEEPVHLQVLCSQENAKARPADAVTTVEESYESGSESESGSVFGSGSESESVQNFNRYENEFDYQGSGSEDSFIDDEDMDAERTHGIGIGSLSPVNEENSHSNGESTRNDDNQSTGNKSNKTKSNLKSRYKNTQCKVCQKKFKYPCQLKRHSLTHSGQKRHVCDICEKRFGHVGNLNVHKRKHETAKPYSCGVCQKSFTQLGNMKKHNKIHTKKKTHNCIFCEKNFLERSTLFDHLRIHTGEKPFGCPDCNRQFRTKSNLQIHKKNQHPTK